jgi:hypothetical protein
MPKTIARPKRSKQSPAAAGRLAAGDRKQSPVGAADFYEAALGETERLLLEQARDQRGLAEEMALLRLKLRASAEEHPEDLSRFLRLLELLTRMVATQYRVSKEAEGDLAASLAGVLKGVGGVLGLGEDGDEAAR